MISNIILILIAAFLAGSSLISFLVGITYDERGIACTSIVTFVLGVFVGVYNVGEVLEQREEANTNKEIPAVVTTRVQPVVETIITTSTLGTQDTTYVYRFQDYVELGPIEAIQK